MKKEFYPDIEYNSKKRRKAIIYSLIAIFFSVSMAIFLFSSKNYWFGVCFLLICLLPAFAVPMAFKNYKVDGKPVVVIDGDSVIVKGKKLEIKELLKVTVIIEIPASNLDSENFKLLESLKTYKPELDDFGTLDFFYKDEKGNNNKIFTDVNCAVEALVMMIKAGLKKYSLSYSIKKNTVRSDYDLKNIQLEGEVQEKANKSTKKSKVKQLI